MISYEQFKHHLASKLTGAEITEQVISAGRHVCTDGTKVYVDYMASEYASIKEATSCLKNNELSQAIQSIVSDTIQYNDYRVLNVIKESTGCRLTNTLVETYVDAVNNRTLTLDETVHAIRDRCIKSNINNKVLFVLEDGASVAIDSNTLSTLRKLFKENTDVVEYMRTSSSNFNSVLKQIIRN